MQISARLKVVARPVKRVTSASSGTHSQLAKLLKNLLVQSVSIVLIQELTQVCQLVLVIIRIKLVKLLRNYARQDFIVLLEECRFPYRVQINLFA